VKEFWDFSELTGYGATGDPSKAMLAKGELMRDALVTYLVDYMNRRRASGWAYNPKSFGAPETPFS
jgi:creatinine amidohydrolase